MDLKWTIILQLVNSNKVAYSGQVQVQFTSKENKLPPQWPIAFVIVELYIQGHLGAMCVCVRVRVCKLGLCEWKKKVG